MKAGILLLLAAWLAAAQTPVKQLDGSTIGPAEIDATVTKLLKAGEVTGAGITVFNRGEAAYSKASPAFSRKASFNSSARPTMT